jgi:hypothetical protein
MKSNPVGINCFKISHIQNMGRNYLERHGLLSLLEEISQRSNSTGVSLPVYASLHHYIKTTRPKYMLECGTGISTHIIARAMRDYCYDHHNGQIKLVSMESKSQWFEEAMSNYPDAYRDFLEIRFSPVGVYQYAFLKGTIYKDVPSYPYDVVFVDGPYHHGMCNMDLIRILEEMDDDRTIVGIIDGRKATVLSYQAILGKMFVNYYLYGMSYIGPVAKDNLISKMNLDHIFNMNTVAIENIPFE